MRLKNFFLLFFSGLCALGLAWGLRYGLVEVESLAAGCAQGGEGRCLLRTVAIALFEGNRLGLASLLAAGLALALRWRGLAWLGWLAGLMGLVLYCFEASAVGALLALLILARHPQPLRPKHTQSASQS
jgi:hypothetical protein